MGRCRGARLHFDEPDDNEKKKGPDMAMENDVLENKNK